MLVDLEGWIVLARDAILGSEELHCLIDEDAWRELFGTDGPDFSSEHPSVTFPLRP